MRLFWILALMRNRIVEDIMVYKEANNVPILQPEQEAKQRNGWNAPDARKTP